MNYPSVIKSGSEEETAAMAENFIKSVAPGDVVVLNGNLGAGKTFFIKSALRTLGIDNVNSPTFAIVNEYSDGYKFYHFDFYRINGINELYDIGFNDYLNDPEAVIFIEWGSLIPEILPRRRIEIDIDSDGEFSRVIKFLKYE